MSWLGALGLTSGFVLRNLLSQESNPNKVLEVKSEQYSDRFIHCREDALVLYGPRKEKSSKEKYEIVLQRPCTETLYQAFSLFRSNELQDAEVRFLQLKDKVPLLVGISREVCNLGGIQKLCNALEEHPSWTAAHLASFFALHDTFQNPVILSHLNSPDVNTGISPLQVAIKTCNLRTVQVLLGAKASLEHLDYDANSVFHYAASTSKDIILALSAESSKCLNYRNSNGHTPLHVACLADKPDCVKALLMAGADVNIAASQVSEHSSTTPPGYVGDFLHDNPNKLYAEDMKYGGTPLHWSCSRGVIEALVDMGCDINAVNFNGHTALHIMVLRNRLECVVALLSREVDVNIGDHDGNTPLHLAVTRGSLAIVQALIVFGADLSYKNNSGATPRHVVPPDSEGDKKLYYLHAVGAPRCPLDMDGCTPGCTSRKGSSEDHNGVPPAVPPSSASREVLNQMLSVAGMDMAASSSIGIKGTKGGRLLCLDGGGIRGLVLVVMLLELEKAVGRPVIHCFDWVAGTSTGGILTLGLAAGKTLKECLCLYFRMKEHAFVGGRPYGSEPLENILREALGTDTVMADIKNPKIIITGVLADRKPVDLHLFRNYMSPSQMLRVEQTGMFKPPPPPEEQLLWRAARATGAAPSYFRAFGRFLDGGLVANNPTLDALTEIHEYNLALKASGRLSEVRPPTVVVSLGTGLVPVTQLKEIDVFRPESLWDTARLAIGISALGTLLVDQATASDGRVVDRARAWCSMIGVPYYRFTPQMSEDIAMDEKNDEKLVNMLWEAKAYIHSNYNVVKEVARLLNEE
ncbi:85/88 kDa calcium-independent phospholipase A2 isoform X2 [Periplaneta americana]|uniref:85/88 kDa calcium-independent phospholipase A2 isoform X2 n=1 Tax=Periplaneta americana TaxID=6978 RepID=UPI0037E8A694